MSIIYLILHIIYSLFILVLIIFLFIILGPCRVTQQPLPTTNATLERQHSNGNNSSKSIVVSSTMASGANMYLFDVSSGAGLGNSQNIITTTSAITLNNLDPIVQHRITAGKPVLASKVDKYNVI
jgi:hypothetical protein